MKVLHVIPSIGPQRGGPSVAAPATCAAIRSTSIRTRTRTRASGSGRLLCAHFCCADACKRVMRYRGTSWRQGKGFGAPRALESGVFGCRLPSVGQKVWV